MFLEEPPLTPEVRSMFAQDINEHGYVANSTRSWAWRPDVFEAFKQARVITGETMDLSPREFAVLISATVARNNDAYCALAWGSALAEEAGEGTAVEVLTGVGSGGMSAREASLAAWASRVTADATSTTADDVELLRDVGSQIGPSSRSRRSSPSGSRTRPYARRSELARTSNSHPLPRLEFVEPSPSVGLSPMRPLDPGSSERDRAHAPDGVPARDAHVPS